MITRDIQDSDIVWTKEGTSSSLDGSDKTIHFSGKIQGITIDKDITYKQGEEAFRHYLNCSTFERFANFDELIQNLTN